MTPGARISAAIECLDQIFSGMPAEKALTGWARRSRFAGSKDRAAVRDHVFDALRSRDSFAADGGELTGRSVMIGLVRLQGLAIEELFNGVGHAPEPLSDEEHSIKSHDWRWDMPDWCVEKLKASHPNSAMDVAKALKARAPVDLRVNVRKISLPAAQAALRVDAIETEKAAVSDSCLRITENPRKLKQSKAYLDGLVELQDVGSQALVKALPLKPGDRILDFCAGGGGKSLAMLAAIDAVCFAHDANPTRMKDIPLRAERAGVSIQQLSTAEMSQHGPYDLVLCDAPCSGSGSWRRSPDAKWRLGKDQFDNLLSLQGEILWEAAHRVEAGGYLCYATCSLFAEENENQVNEFLKRNTNFTMISQHSWTPLDSCDGFYVAIMQLKG